MSLYTPRSTLEERFDAEAVEPMTPRYNVAPGDDLAVVPNDRPDEIDRFEWGLTPSWVEDPDDWGRPINARGETVADVPSFRDAFAERRCLVLADGFYEWRDDRSHKQPYRIERTDGEPFAFAGLWEVWGEGGDQLTTATILTTRPNDVVAPIHDRMPVVLEPAEEARWLASGDAETLRSLLDPFPAALTDAYPVSTRVNDPSNDDPRVIDPVDVGEQSGLGEFGA